MVIFNNEEQQLLNGWCENITTKHDLQKKLTFLYAITKDELIKDIVLDLKEKIVPMTEEEFKEMIDMLPFETAINNAELENEEIESILSDKYKSCEN